MRRIKLEFVNFTVQVQLYDGSTHPVSDLSSVQDILNRATEFNKRICKLVRDDGGGGGDEKRKGQSSYGAGEGDGPDRDDEVIVDISLDPLNSTASYHISA